MDLRQAVCTIRMLKVGCHPAFPGNAVGTPIPIGKVSQAMFFDFLLRRKLRIYEFPRVSYPVLLINGLLNLFLRNHIRIFCIA